jgi:lysophospholipase L1-like esterase
MNDRPRLASRAGLIALAVALGASLLANALLVRAALHFVDEATAVRLDPAGLKTYAGGSPTADRRPVLVLFVDSRAAMWKDPSPPSFRVVNRGIGYQTTAQILMRFDADVAPLHPAVVVLEAGVNDLKAIAQFPGRRAEIVADCEANLRRIADDCRKAGATVVIVSVFDIGNLTLWRRPFWSDDVGAAVREVNAFLAGYVGNGVVLFDAKPVLDDSHGVIRVPYQMDYLHLTRAGYDALNRVLVPLVESLPAARREAAAGP